MTTSAPEGFFAPDVNTHDASNKLPFFPRDFIGVVKVVACKGITVREGRYRAFIAELEIETSNMPESVRVGGKYSFFQSLKEPGTAYPAIISFLYAALGLDSIRDKAKIDATVKPRQDQYLNMAINDNPALFGGKVNILAGARLNLQTANKITKKTKTDFTIHSFSPIYVAPSATPAT
jgi:hypothetical protein